MTIGLLGFGTVGVGVYEILEKTPGTTVKYVLDLKLHTGYPFTSTTDINDILSDSEVDTVIELIGGLHPAYEFVVSAIRAGKNVITANKFLICEHYRELTELAIRYGVSLRYTAAVGGGIPWLFNLERIKRVGEVLKIKGIINGTTNYILDMMHKKGEDFSVALKKAQELGYAEADPSADIDGLDTARKIFISACIGYDGVFKKEDAPAFGIGNINRSDICAAESMGCVCRLLGTAEKTENGYAVYTHPVFLPKESQFGAVSENFNLIRLTSSLEGTVSFCGAGAGRYPTAFTVAEDVLDIDCKKAGVYGSVENELTADTASVYCRFYIRTAAKIPFPGEKSGGGFITENISVYDMHKFANENEGTFFAELAKEEK